MRARNAAAADWRSIETRALIGRSRLADEMVHAYVSQWLGGGREQLGTGQEEAHMRCKPRSVAALQVALGGLPDSMQVEADKDIGVSAKTVGELRRVTAWSENLVITTPQERYPESAVKVSKASGSKRTSPKP
jgi:hypothetical protein